MTTRGSAWPERTVILLAGALFAVWSIPETTALRHLLMLVLAGFLGWRTWPGRHIEMLPAGLGVGRAAWWLAALSLWFVLQLPLLAWDVIWSARELWVQWLPGLVALGLGLGLGHVTAGPLRQLSMRQAADRAETRQANLFSLFLILATTEVGVVAFQCWLDLRTQGAIDQDALLTGGKLEMSVLANLVFAMLAADVVARLHGQRLSRLPGWMLPLPAAIGLAGLHWGGARNGALALAALALVFVAALLHRRLLAGRAWMLTLTAAAAVVLTVSGSGLNRRWDQVTDGLAAAWRAPLDPALSDIARGRYPTAESGSPLDRSGYARVLFMRAAMREMRDQPLGLGYGRNALGHALRARGIDNIGHAHSGILDLGVGGGVPAILLWMGFLATLLRQSIRRLVQAGPVALFLFFFVIEYAAHSVLDSVTRDHMLQMAFFMIGLALAAPGRPPHADEHA